jgi:hypothetical protein
MSSGFAMFVLISTAMPVCECGDKGNLSAAVGGGGFKLFFAFFFCFFFIFFFDSLVEADASIILPFLNLPFFRLRGLREASTKAA